MNVSVESIVAMLLPWELSFTIGGKDYSTRPLLLAELMALGSALTPAALAALVSGFFVGEKPDLSGWDTDRLNVIITSIEAYSTDRSKKNNPIIAKAAMGR